jgi:hypothetical protein
MTPLESKNEDELEDILGELMTFPPYTKKDYSIMMTEAKRQIQELIAKARLNELYEAHEYSNAQDPLYYSRRIEELEAGLQGEALPNTALQTKKDK